MKEYIHDFYILLVGTLCIMGNTNSSSKDVVSEHLETIAKCFHEDSLKKDEETGELSGLSESSEDTIAFSL